MNPAMLMSGAGDVMTGMGNLIGGNSFANSNANQNVWAPWGGFFEQMMANAPQTFDRSNMQQGGVEGALPQTTDYNRDLANSAYQNANQLAQGGAYNENNPMYQQLLQQLSASGPSNMGQMYESIVGGSGNTYADPLVDSLRQGGMERLDMMRAGNAQNAAAMGQSGSSRHAMENAMAQRGVNQDLTQAENQIRYGSYDKDLAMKMGIANQADTNQMQRQQDLMSALNSQNTAMNQGIGALNQSKDLGYGMMTPYMLAMQSAWNPMINYSNVMGNPIMESSSSSSSGSKSGLNSLGDLGGAILGGGLF